MHYSSWAESNYVVGQQVGLEHMTVVKWKRV
jgi:hypothetical protein